MIKKFTVPLVDVTFYIYVGANEWKAWKKEVVKQGANDNQPEKCPGEGTGRTWCSWIWLNELDGWELVAHELSHFEDELMNHLHTNDTEFRAFLAGWISDTVLSWVNSQKKKLEKPKKEPKKEAWEA